MREATGWDSEGTRLTHVHRAQHHFTGGDTAPFRAAMARLQAARLASPGEGCLGAVVITETGRGRGMDHVVRFWAPGTEHPAALTLGRHDESALRVPDASLRHAVVLGWPAPEPYGVEVLDLNTASALVLPGEPRPVRAVAHRSALHLGVGSAEVMVARVGPGEAFTALEPPAEKDVVITARDTAVHEDVLEATDGPRPSEKSMAFYFERLDARGARGAADGWADSKVQQGIMAPDGVVRDLAGRVVHPGRWARLALPASAYERGVLLGRYDRCMRSRYMSADNRVSRVHALAVLRHGALWVVDTASTNGTWVMRTDGSARGLRGEEPAAALHPGDTLMLGPCVMELAVDS